MISAFLSDIYDMQVQNALNAVSSYSHRHYKYMLEPTTSMKLLLSKSLLIFMQLGPKVSFQPYPDLTYQ